MKSGGKRLSGRQRHRSPLSGRSILSSGRSSVQAGASTPVVSDFAAAEFASAVARRVRTGQLTQVAAREAFEDLDVWLSGEVHRLQISSADVAATGGFVRRLDLNLRTPDAIHIAMCRRAGATLATFDMRLGEAAQVLGLMLA